MNDGIQKSFTSVCSIQDWHLIWMMIALNNKHIWWLHWTWIMMHLTWMMLIALYRDNDNLNCSQTMMIMMIVRVTSSTHDMTWWWSWWWCIVHRQWRQQWCEGRRKIMLRARRKIGSWEPRKWPKMKETSAKLWKMTENSRNNSKWGIFLQKWRKKTEKGKNFLI